MLFLSGCHDFGHQVVAISRHGIIHPSYYISFIEDNHVKVKIEPIDNMAFSYGHNRKPILQDYTIISREPVLLQRIAMTSNGWHSGETNLIKKDHGLTEKQVERAEQVQSEREESDAAVMGMLAASAASSTASAGAAEE